MKISLDWIGDFVDLPEGLSDREITRRITLKVCEVEEYESSSEHGVVTNPNHGNLVLNIDNKSLTHRPDLWGHYGMAREFALVFDSPFRDKFDAKWTDSLKRRIEEAKEAASASVPAAPITIEVEGDTANLGFLGLVMNDIRVAQSPLWMQRRLMEVGLRPINSIVDISNYVMLETGIPNHIFDNSTIREGKIIVRRAGSTQHFVTLDGLARHLVADDTLVCDADKPSGIAGIMGGLGSSVSESTSQIMIEVANWKDVEIRQTSTRLGLRTDASVRYEKSLDSAQLEKTLLRIFELVLELNPGAHSVGEIQAANMPSPIPLEIETGPKRIGSVLGIAVDENRFGSILKALGFGVRKLDEERSSQYSHKVSVPTWRSTKDIECEADIAEEIGRFIGYDSIAPLSAVHNIEALRLSPKKTTVRRAQDFMVLRGQALEIYNYPLLGEALLSCAFWPDLNEGLVLANALNPDIDRMRPTLIPSLLQATANNLKEHSGFRIFEFGRAYKQLDSPEFFAENLHLGVVFQDLNHNPFVELADIIEGLCRYAGRDVSLIPGEFSKNHALIPVDWPGLHPIELLDVKIGELDVGTVFSLHSRVGQAFRIKGRTAIAVLDFDALMDMQEESEYVFTSLDRYPRADFDLTVVVPKAHYGAEVLSVVKNLGMKEIRKVGVLDSFNLSSDARALTLRVEFRDSRKTLNPTAIKEAQNKVIASLDAAGYPLRNAEFMAQ
ncbi:hypothetical protein JY97_04635 [Alkalispirochaeta odontotermitis]|nr:hypothetical protein JY97_04635 [Alkalispirochaeta odontotermitis]